MASALITAGVVAGTVFLLAAVLATRRPGLALGGPLAVALGARILAAAAYSLAPASLSLRGGDETLFLQNATEMATLPFSSYVWGDTATTSLFEAIFAFQIKVLDSPEFIMRVTQTGISVIGILLLATAVYELAGARAGVITAWILALEPTGVFFSGLLHKEPNLFLAEGLVVFGLATFWRRGTLISLLPVLGGSALALATRPYAGWFLIAAAALVVLHGSVRLMRRSILSAIPLMSVVLLGVALYVPIIAGAVPQLSEELQESQNANALRVDESLALERVDYSSGAAIITNLPRRMRDVLLRPYPWQLENWSQRLALLGTIVMLGGLYLLIRLVIAHRGRIMSRAGPLVYTAASLLLVYSLSAGNAGTAFRYRSHVIAVAVCLIIVLLETAGESRRSALQRSDPNETVPRKLVAA